MNYTWFAHEFTNNDYFWENLKEYTISGQSREIWVQNLPSKMAFRFRLKQCYEKDMDVCSKWTVWKLLTTTVQHNFEENEYSYLYVKGTGLNNHAASVVKVDDNLILKHANYKGLYLIVLDRRTLKTVFMKSYNTLQE